jgi:hypothetical protein
MIKAGYCEFNSNKLCDDCNDCNICDVDSTKICNSCGKCIELEGLDYERVIIEGLVENHEELDEYILDDDNLISDIIGDEDNEFAGGFEYIEDIPELREEYEKRIEQILRGSVEDEHSDVCDEGCGCHGHDHDHKH